MMRSISALPFAVPLAPRRRRAQRAVAQARRAAPPTRARRTRCATSTDYVAAARPRPAHFPDGWRFRAGGAPVRRAARDRRERCADREPRRQRDHATRRQRRGRRGRRRRSRSPSCIPKRATSAAAASWSSIWPTAGTPRSTIARWRRSPRRATCTSDSDGKVTDQSIVGPLASGVPGAVAGLTAALARYGTMPLARVMQPAIRLAERRLRRRQRVRAATSPTIAHLLGKFGGASVFVPDGQPLARRRDAQAAGARADAARDRAQRARRVLPGRRSPRRGRASCARAGGIITMEDLRRYQPGMAHADPLDVSRPHAADDAAVVVGRRDDDGDAEHPRGVRLAARRSAARAGRTSSARRSSARSWTATRSSAIRRS